MHHLKVKPKSSFKGVKKIISFHFSLPVTATFTAELRKASMWGAKADYELELLHHLPHSNDFKHQNTTLNPDLRQKKMTSD